MDGILPPSFNGSVMVFAFALFGLLLSAAVSLAMIVHIFRDAGFIRRGLHTPFAHFQMGKALLFAAILAGTFGDLLILLTWNEVSASTEQVLFMVDRLLDFATVVPILLSAILFIRGEPEMHIHLIRPPLPHRLYVNWDIIRNQLKIGFVAAILAAGVAFGKAFY